MKTMLRRNEGGFRRPESTTSRVLTLAAIVVVGVLALSVVRSGFIDLPDWFGGGESDPAPRGSVTYEGQTAQSASEEFLIDIGDGEAIVSVKAKQDWDTPGSVLRGDFQSTNGTSSVADPDDRGVPAQLRVATDYCASGIITTTESTDPDTDEPVRTVRLEMGDIFVCNTTLEHTIANDSAFKQDDTPNDFHGRFVSFVAGAVETTAAAAACPREELARFRSPEFTNYAEGRLADRFGLPADNVQVVPGRIGETDEETQRDLREALESYANMQDPDDPDRTFEALSIQYLSGDGEAVEDSCYRDPGATDLDSLESVGMPEQEDR